ncbi:unnamed protein product [Ascophyllum nodosum]
MGCILSKLWKLEDYVDDSDHRESVGAITAKVHQGVDQRVDEPLFQTPRVNGAVLEQFLGQTVCLVGKVISHQEGAPDAELETSDGVRITVTLAAGSTWTSQYVEVIGHLHEDSTLQEFKSTDFGDSFDMGLYDRAVALMTGKFSHLFYSAQE